MRKNMEPRVDDIRNELKKGINGDIHLEKFHFSLLKRETPREVTSLDTLELSVFESLSAVGVNLDDRSQTGKYLLYGQDAFTLFPQIDGVEMLPIEEALERYPEIRKKYLFKAVNADQDAFTKAVAEIVPRGYFIRVKKGVRVEEPLQAGLFMHKEMSSMGLHNIVVLEEGAQLHLVTGCTSACTLQGGLHIAISEHFVGKNAQLINTMIHNWGPEFLVRPRGGTIVKEGGNYVSNYYSFKPPKDIEMNPFIHLKGENSTAKNMTVLVCLPETYSNIGGTILMTGENSSAEIVARAVNHGGTVIQTGLLIGAAKDARAHVDCSGLMLSDSGIIEAIPGLRAMHPDARLSHEAAIGRIDMGEVHYLQSKGLDEMQAIALIVRGFLDIGIELEGFAPELKRTIQEISTLSGHGEA
ncbi:MAG: SufD family Fe-S cluster assembly protein [Candidatus Vecturithrix sp.]|jgi:Fe-S cluster assembly scaffold protein SufB|nr:SufD family Fe-S cluster assembly protein [Candidatus Vecturithrix sp.]